MNLKSTSFSTLSKYHQDYHLDYYLRIKWDKNLIIVYLLILYRVVNI